MSDSDPSPDSAGVAFVMARERRDYKDETHELLASLVTNTKDGPVVYCIYSYSAPSFEAGPVTIPPREGIRWVVRPPGGGGASGPV